MVRNGGRRVARVLFSAASRRDGRAHVSENHAPRSYDDRGGVKLDEINYVIKPDSSEVTARKEFENLFKK